MRDALIITLSASVGFTICWLLQLGKAGLERETYFCEGFEKGRRYGLAEARADEGRHSDAPEQRRNEGDL